MRSFGGGDITAAWQVGCGRSVFEQSFEHGVWPARHREHTGEDNHRRRGSFHADRLDAFLAWYNWFAFRVAVNGS